ncbi:hypothetical protein B4U84_24140 [Westiellopsis prolifica IICB1]|nr:hypothetical protein B4U84_24140 [Westiellopsis prolifica IICB1]
MVRNIRWDESVLKNILSLVDALLLLAEQQPENLQPKPQIYVYWEDDKLRVTGYETKQTSKKRAKTVEVGTTQKHLLNLLKKVDKSLILPRRKQKSGSSDSERKLREVQYFFDSLKELELLKVHKQSRGYWIFTIALKHQTATREENLEVVKQKWKKHPKTNSPQISQTPLQIIDDTIDWREVCRQPLEKHKQLTSKQLMCADAMVFDIDKLHVPLALIERKEPDKRSGDDNTASSRLYQPEYEEREKFEYKEFLSKVLQSQQSHKIAIIGEPGAGKTTLLQRIAFWILDQNDNLPIFISLGNLGNSAPKFQDILNNWLEDILGSEAKKRQAEFEKLLSDGKVWLLLDGVDEMAADRNPLKFIDTWIPNWCQRCRVVLTCRLNVWEANPYALNAFQTYRTLQFSQEKVEDFIKACFKNPNDAQQLQQALNQPGKERIKDLVKNPLRLTLLCSTWHLRDGKLPNTKAELYQMYVDKFYDWKKDEFPTTSQQRKQLNAKLGKLALKAIDQKEKRFCLQKKFIEDVFDDDSLFDLAVNKLAWLNQVGVDAKNPNEPVYAFYHPTFQEYFVAHWFMQHQDFRRLSRNVYQPHWREVFLLTVGMLSDSVWEKLLKLIQQQINASIKNNNKLQEFLTCVQHKAHSMSNGRYKPAAVRAFYFYLARLEFSCIQELIHPNRNILAYEIDPNFRRDMSSGYEQCSDFKFIFSLPNDIALDIALALVFDGDIALVYALQVIKLIFELELTPQFQLELQFLESLLPSQFKDWDKENWHTWLKYLHNTMIEHRKIGHDWQFTKAQEALLQQYYDANKLLLDCLNESKISSEVRQEIEGTLLFTTA